MDEETSKKNGQQDIRKVKQAYRRSRKIKNWKKDICCRNASWRRGLCPEP